MLPRLIARFMSFHCFCHNGEEKFATLDAEVWIMLNLFENLCPLREWCISNFQAYWAFQTDESFSKLFKFQRSLAISQLLEKFQTMVVRHTIQVQLLSIIVHCSINVACRVKMNSGSVMMLILVLRKFFYRDGAQFYFKKSYWGLPRWDMFFIFILSSPIPFGANIDTCWDPVLLHLPVGFVMSSCSGLLERIRNMKCWQHVGKLTSKPTSKPRGMCLQTLHYEGLGR